MSNHQPGNEDHVNEVIETRLAALEKYPGLKETVTIEWRGHQMTIPVISMPVDLLSYNPGTHRVRAQRTSDPTRNLAIENDPFGSVAQAYLHELLMGLPSDPSKVDPSFIALQEDLARHGQTEPGIITRAGILINGNTRRAALKENGTVDIRVAVLPPDAGRQDLDSIELSLQLRKDHKRDYSFMNFLLAIEESAQAGRSPADIQKDFRIKATTYERSRWILDFIRDAIERSRVETPNSGAVALRLVDFEKHQGKLEELYRTYTGLKPKDPESAEALREQRLLAIVLDKSKTDLRLIEPDFAKYMKTDLPTSGQAPTADPEVTIPGTSIKAPGASAAIKSLREQTTTALRARALAQNPSSIKPERLADADATLKDLNESVDRGLDRAGKQVRVLKKRLAPVDRLSDAHDDLELALGAVAEARSTKNFNPDDLDEALQDLAADLHKLAQLVTRGADSLGDGLAWLQAVGELTERSG